MKKKLAFVLSGGGSRGAMQAGALRALLEAGFHPDMVTGSSIGAANGAFLAVHGYTLPGVQQLEQVWKATVDQNLLPTHLWWQMMQTFFGRADGHSQQRIRDFALAHGLTRELRFRDILGVELYFVAADLNTGYPVIFGRDPDESVLESMLISMALPPWMAPQEKDGRFLVDGGFVSNLPIEAALNQGATEIIALDLFDPTEVNIASRGVTPLISKLNLTVIERQLQLELQLAEARGVPVRRVELAIEQPVPLWDFRRSGELIEQGYQLTCRAMAAWQAEDSSSWWRRSGIKAIVEGLLEVLE